MNFDNTPSANNDTVALDPVTSERRFYREPFTGVVREVWRPGDGDGDQSGDYFDRQGGPLPLENRWRLFQSDIGPIGVSKAMPPKHVMLDDLAVYELVTSDIPRAQLTRNWEHDFAGQGKIRARRPHRGRPAVKHCDEEGVVKHHFVPFGANNAPYYFTGEKDYKPIVYKELPPPQLTEEELERKRRAESPPEYNPRAHGHNQHTPKDMLVKHGAPTFSRKPKSDDLKIPRYIPQLPRGFGQTTAPPAIKRKIGNDTAFPIEREEQRTGKGESSSIHSGRSSEPSGPVSPGVPNEDPSEGQQALPDKAQESDSDEEFPLGRPKAPKSGTPVAASATVNSLTQDVPRLMPYIERRAHEQKLAEEMINRVENKQDVERIANELAEANVRLVDQDREIERLRAALALAQADAAEANSKAIRLEEEIARLQQVN